MAGDQAAGHGVESNRGRQVRPNRDAEAIVDAEVTTRSPQKDKSDKNKYQGRVQGHPRRCSTPSTMADTPSASAPSSRTPSPDSSAQYPPEPPVTKATLSELDVNKIIQNPKLRHDINFDPDLHFRPNLDGEKGRKKQEKANLFWTALVDQLSAFVVDRDGFRAKHQDGKMWRLPALLTAVKEIIQTLVPVRDRSYLDDGLDVKVLMQQFDRGVADLEKLALWLSGVLKSHCAPMRDEWVDDMYNELSEGNRNNDILELVKGMRNLLNVLEAMKLDVANHQIRCLRPVLIEDTVAFEHRYQKRRMDTGRTNTENARRWYQEACNRYGMNLSRGDRRDFGDTAVLFHGILELLLPSTADKKITSLHVFQFDEDRMYKLRAEILDSINLEICMLMHEELESRLRLPTTGNHCARRPQMLTCHDDGGFPGLSRDLCTLLNSSSVSGSRPSSLASSDAGSRNSSPSRRSSVMMPPSFVDAAESRCRSKSLSNSLLALLGAAVSPTPVPPTFVHKSRWQADAPHLALEIFRHTNASNDLFPQFEADLLSRLSSCDSDMYRKAEATLHRRLLSVLSGRVSEFKGLTAINLFSAATGGRVQRGPGRTWDSFPRDGDSLDGSSIWSRADDNLIEGMATRIAHLGVLHWRVWGSLLYDNCLDRNVEMTDVSTV